MQHSAACENFRATIAINVPRNMILPHLLVRQEVPCVSQLPPSVAREPEVPISDTSPLVDGPWDFFKHPSDTPIVCNESWLKRTADDSKRACSHPIEAPSKNSVYTSRGGSSGVTLFHSTYGWMVVEEEN